MPTTPNELSGQVIGAAIEIHRALGPGLLESAYQRCLALELRLRGIAFVEQTSVPVIYKGIPVDCGYRLDFVVDGRLILEIKAVETILPIHRAQVLTYLKLTRLRRALLINFNVVQLVSGVQSLVL